MSITKDFARPIWTSSRADLKSSVNLPLVDRSHVIVPSLSTLRKRLERSDKNSSIEPIYISVLKDKKSARTAAHKYAKRRNIEDLYNYLLEAPAGLYESSKKSKYRRVILNQQAMSFISLNKFRKKFAANHHELYIDAQKLKKDPRLSRKLFAQLDMYHPYSKIRDFRDQVANASRISVDESLLPKFAEKMVGKFPIFRGPNCFHASVAFQDEKFPTYSYVNLREEPDHHKVMINHDELWRILTTYFYEVNPKESDLKYGDIIAFFDVPKGQQNKPVSYKWLKHASSYLFSGYLFSKGSKSPNTPYSVKTLNEEWNTWKKYTTNLNVKVFRRSFKNVKRVPPANRTDWLF